MVKIVTVGGLFLGVHASTYEAEWEEAPPTPPLVWTVVLKHKTHAAPLASADGTKVFLGDTAFDSKTGEVLWKNGLRKNNTRGLCDADKYDQAEAEKNENGGCFTWEAEGVLYNFQNYPNIASGEPPAVPPSLQSFDEATGSTKDSVELAGKPFVGMAFANSTFFAHSISADQSTYHIKAWDVKTHENKWDVEKIGWVGSKGTTEPSPDGSMLLIGGPDPIEGQPESKENGSVQALDAATGDRLWAFYEADARLDQAVWRDDGSVVFSTFKGTYYALDGTTGDKLWTFRTDAAFGHHSSFFRISAGTLYYCHKKSLVAMDISSPVPTQKWALETHACKEERYSNRFPLSNDGKYLLLSDSLVNTETQEISHFPGKFSSLDSERRQGSPSPWIAACSM